MTEQQACTLCGGKGKVCVEPYPFESYEDCPKCAQKHPEQAAGAQEELWAVHARGPDDLYAAFSREDADRHAAELNALPVPEGISVGAVVIPSPWTPTEHWQYLAEQEREHKDAIEVQRRNLASTLLSQNHALMEARAALAQPSQSQYEASFEEWLANELEGEDGQPVPAAVCDIALARRAFNHWPKLEQPAKVGGVRFSAGVSSRLVVEAAQRLYEFESTPEKEAERIERLQAFREQLDPLNLAPHAEAFNEAPAEVLKPEQAERPEVVAWLVVAKYPHKEARRAIFMYEANADDQGAEWCCDDGVVTISPLIDRAFVAQAERIAGALRAENAKLIEALDESDGDRWRLRSERDAALAEVEALRAELQSQRERNTELIFKLGSATNGWGRCEKERDAALARVAELETHLSDAVEMLAEAEALLPKEGGSSRHAAWRKFFPRFITRIGYEAKSPRGLELMAPVAQDGQVPDHAAFLDWAEKVLNDEQERLSGEDYLMDSNDCIQVLREAAAPAQGE